MKAKERKKVEVINFNDTIRKRIVICEIYINDAVPQRYKHVTFLNETVTKRQKEKNIYAKY